MSDILSQAKNSAWLRRWFGHGISATPVLAPYHLQNPPFRRTLKRGGLLGFCMVIGTLYGFLFTLLPSQLLIILAAPIFVLALLVIWALPDMTTSPTKLLAGLFFTYLLVIVLWPKYIALQIPGLPWISLRRLVALPMTIVLLICYSVSSEFRLIVRRALKSNYPLFAMMVTLLIVQSLTIPLSNSVSSTINEVINYWFLFLSSFFVGLALFSRTDHIDRFVTAILTTTIFIALISILEYRNQGVIWANHIPFFLQIDAEILSQYLSPITRDGEYRTTATFANSLCLAEYLALVTPFAFHRLASSRGLGAMLVWAAIDLGLLGIINLTQSRLGIVGWLFGHAIYGVIWGFRRWKRNRTDLVAPSISLLYPLGVIILVIGMFTIPAIRNRTIGGGSTGFSDDARGQQFSMMWPKLFENPFGYGAGSSGGVLQYRVPSGAITVDSYIVTVLLDYGILGFFAFFGMFFFAIAKMVKVYWLSDNHHGDLALPVGTALAVAIQIRSVLSQIDNLAILYMLLSLAAVLAWNLQRTGAPVTARHGL